MNNRLVNPWNALRALWVFRDKLIEGIIQDVRYRYAGSVLGVAWSVLFPLAQLVIYSVVYVFIFRVRPGAMNQYQYVILVFSGLLPLLAFNEGLISGAGALNSNKSLLLSTVFPAELIPLRVTLAAQVPSMFGFLIVIVLAFFFGHAVWFSLLFVPILWLMLIMLAVGLAWLLSLLSLVARDIQQVLPLTMMGLMILSPFAYTPDMVPATLKLILYLNPLSYYVLCFQHVICYGTLPDPLIFLAAFLISCISFFGGFWVFHRVKFVFFDYA